MVMVIKFPSTPKQKTMLCAIQNTGKRPVKNQYGTFLYINTIHY